MDRRNLLFGSAGLFGGLTLGAPMARALGSLALPDGAAPRLVLVQLSGGNDGLNTVVPTEDAAYRAARPRLSAVADEALAIGKGFGLHPSLSALHRHFVDGAVAVVHGVGYPDPNLSHFKSTDIWHTARSTGRLSSTTLRARRRCSPTGQRRRSRRCRPRSSCRERRDAGR